MVRGHLTNVMGQHLISRPCGTSIARSLTHLDRRENVFREKF